MLAPHNNIQTHKNTCKQKCKHIMMVVQCVYNVDVHPKQCEYIYIYIERETSQLMKIKSAKNTCMMRPTLSLSISWKRLGSVRMNIARYTNNSCVNIAVDSSAPYALWMSTRSSDAGSGAVMVTSWWGGSPTVTCFWRTNKSVTALARSSTLLPSIPGGTENISNAPFLYGNDLCGSTSEIWQKMLNIYLF